MAENKDIRLIVEIKNEKPIELLELTKSLISFANQFNTYVNKYADSKDAREAKLYVKEIRSGSVIFELIETATAGVIPFLENLNTIVGFVDYCKKTFDYFLKKKGEKPLLTTTDYRELSQIVNPIAKDNGSQLNISTTINGNVEYHINLSSIESNALQNIFKNESEQLKLPEQVDDVKSNVLLTWFQARSDIKSEIGNKAIIEELSNKAVNVVFDTDKIKEDMLHSEINPFKTVFVVDVKLQTVQGKVAAYKIINLHKSFELDEN